MSENHVKLVDLLFGGKSAIKPIFSLYNFVFLKGHFSTIYALLLSNFHSQLSVCIIACILSATFVANSLGNDELLSNKKVVSRNSPILKLKWNRLSFSPARPVLLAVAESFPIFSTISETHLMRIRWSWRVTPLPLFYSTKIT